MNFKETADRQNDRQNHITTRRLTIMVAKVERSRTNGFAAKQSISACAWHSYLIWTSLCIIGRFAMFVSKLLVINFYVGICLSDKLNN